MSLDLADESPDQVPSPRREIDHPDAKDQWVSLRKKIRVRAEKKSPKDVFGDYAKSGAVYSWGISTSTGESVAQFDRILSKLACGVSVRRKDLAEIDFAQEAKRFSEETVLRSASVAQSCRVVRWAAALPSLIDLMEHQEWWNLLGDLQQMVADSIEHDGASSLERLLLGCELGLTLAWRLADLPSCTQMKKPCLQNLVRWCENDEDSIASCIQSAVHARVSFASLFRSRLIQEQALRTKFKRQQKNLIADLATWVAALTNLTGTSAFSEIHPSLVKDDTKKTGVLAAAIQCDPESLAPAMSAALGKSQSGGRLVFEVSLPESIQHSEEAKLAVLLPEWDVRRGRVHVDYSDRDNNIEMFAGKTCLLSGTWNVGIAVDDNDQRPVGEWVTSCEYSDDDVHYLELEQPWSSGLILQRQFMVVRDDRAVLLSDSVLRGNQADDDKTSLRYTSHLPLRSNIQALPEAETREIMFAAMTSQQKQKRNAKQKPPSPDALVIPLAATEWRVGHSPCTLRIGDDGQLIHAVTGTNGLYAPLWFDFQKRRFKAKRTWRQLTVAQDLRTVGQDEAIGFRIQMGSEQWLLYRSLVDSLPRTVLGKHLTADFYAARFHMSDGSVEELVTVDANEDD